MAESAIKSEYDAQSDFSQRLLKWYIANKREMPWRNEKDPYKIWISEIMLQQTRVDQALPYYNRFISEFPTVQKLAAAGQQDVLKAWEGLGYYSRARNLHAAAKTVVNDLDGKIPQDYDEIIRLKGIGPYTAAAITSIAFNKAHAVVDGNVIRVICRFFGIREDTRLASVKKQVQQLADELIDYKKPGDFNQALMELGARVCTPSGPDCSSCPLKADCVACKTAATSSIPYKSPAKKKPHHEIGVGIIEDETGNILIALRPDNVMLGGLWEFPGGKQHKNEKIEETVIRELKEELGVDIAVGRKITEFKHVYSHFSIKMHAFMCRITSGKPYPKASCEIRWVKIEELNNYPFPKANKILVEKLLDES